VNTEQVDQHLTAKIVVSYVRHQRLRPDQLSDLITSVHRAIGQLGEPPEPDEVLTPAVSVRRSVHRDYVTCLDCGYRGRTLRRHISIRHGLSWEEYRQRWGLRSNHPLTAPAYSEHRSTMAKACGFGRKSTAQVATAIMPTAAPTLVVEPGSQATPIRRRRSRAASGAADVTSEAAAATPTQRRRSRSASKSLSADDGHEVLAEPKSVSKRPPRSRVASPQREQTSSPTVPS
jgi:predicted transcriptional regulator